jgi:bifunctional DNA-binding transcriptional regulator/antitoxin component of YhaV-PrlF toxin-antitoxin module
MTQHFAHGASVLAQTCDTETGDPHYAGVRRQAGIKPGDRLEFKASRGVITILTKPNDLEGEYTSSQRRMIDREIAKGLEDVKKGRVHGPFTASQATGFIKSELRARGKKPKLR